MNIDAWLLDILACPKCRASLRPDDSAGELVCSGCGLAYPVLDDIPVLLVDEARQPSSRGRPAGPRASVPGRQEFRDGATDGGEGSSPAGDRE